MKSMREAYILGFRFRFVGQSGGPKRFLRKSGSVTRDGIFLDEQRIFIEDVHSVSTHRSKVIINLLPYATTTREICQHIIPRHNSIVIQVEELLAEKIKSIIDQRCTGLVLQKKWKDIKPENRGKHYKHIACARCDSIIDITNVRDSNLVHCKYCEAIFDHFGYMLAGSEDYKICPECGYYGRIGNHLDFKFHGMGQDGFSSRSYYCCDTCAHRIFLKNVWKNMALLVGFGVTIFEKLRSKRNRNPFYKELTEANLLAQNGDMINADILYSSITFRNDGHPGLHLNYGMAYLKHGDRDRAAFQFKKSLEACSNYLPTLEILKRNVDLVPEE
ncbi:MAG: tetratricopeptide repeat protein [Flammeovirgaceae bacterium]